MELITDCKCACADCGHVIEYRSWQAGEVVECPKCKEKSVLPDSQKLIVLEQQGPPTPEFRNCDVCGNRMNFKTVLCPTCEESRRRKRLLIRVGICVAALVILAGAGMVAFHISQAKARADAAAAANTIPSGSRILIEQPRPKMPKSTNDLRAGTFVLQKHRDSDIAIGVGDIENISDNTHTQIKATLDLLDKKGAKIGSLNDFMTVLGPHQSWHLVESITDTNAASLRFAGITEE